MTSTSPLQQDPARQGLPAVDHAAAPIGSEAHASSPHAGEHGEHPDLRLFGLTTFLVADGMTFAGFFAAYLTFRAVNPLPAGSTYELELLLPTLNTVLLLLSSLQLAEQGVVSPDQPFGLEATEIYWHFVDGIWVVLYLLLYLL